MIEVILSQDVDKVGKAGSVVKVKEGYARNFLIPNNLAVFKTPGNLKKIEDQKKRKDDQVEKMRKESLALQSRLASVSLTIPVLAKEEDKLYGSITAQDITNALKDEGYNIDKAFILLDEPLKALGIYEVKIKLPPDVLAQVKVWIVKK